MKKFLMMLWSLAIVSSALAQQQPQTNPLPLPLPLPGVTSGQGNAAAASGTGISGAKLSLASIGIGSHCSSVVLEDTENPDKAWILPRVFLGVNRYRQKLFDVAAPVVPGDPWRLRFSIFLPHNVNDVLGQGDEDDFFTHGCDFSAVQRELEVKAQAKADAEYDARLKEYGNWAWAHRMFGHRPDPVKITLTPVMPYKLRVTVDKYGEAWIPSKDESGAIDTTVLHTYGWDHEVTIPFRTEDDLKRFMRDFDRDNKIGVKVQVTVFFSAARKNGSISCTSHQGSLDTSFKGHLKGNPDVQKLVAALGGGEAGWAKLLAKDPPIDMLKFNVKNELSNSYTGKEIQCDLNGSTSEAFNQMATDVSKAVVADLLPNLLSISQQQAGPLAGQLPAPLPIGSPFSPLPPLPIPGGMVGPCPPGTDPVTFSQQNQGQQCDPGQDVDRDKHYLKLSALMSAVKKVADTKTQMNLVAPPSDEKFTTFVQLIGKPENKAYRALSIPSSLGPIQVIHTSKEIQRTDKRGKTYKSTVDVVTEKTMANGRGYRTGVDMDQNRVVRIYPIARVKEELSYRNVSKWATWRDIAEFTKKGVDFRIQNHSYGWNVANKTGISTPYGIMNIENSEIQKQVNGYMADPTFPVFTGNVYDRAFHVVSRPRVVAKKITLPFTAETLFTKDEAGNARGFNVGFRGVNKTYTMSQLLQLNDNNISVATDTDGDGRPYIELTAKKNLGELTIFNMDPHACTNAIEVDGIKSCQPDWVQRIYVEYGRVAALTFLTNLFGGNNTGVVPWWILNNDDVAHRGDPYLISSDIDAFKQVLPKTRSSLKMDLEVTSGMETNIQKLIAKKTDSIGLLADPQLSANPSDLPANQAGAAGNTASPVAIPPPTVDLSPVKQP